MQQATSAGKRRVSSEKKAGKKQATTCVCKVDVDVTSSLVRGAPIWLYPCYACDYTEEINSKSHIA